MASKENNKVENKEVKNSNDANLNKKIDKIIDKSLNDKVDKIVNESLDDKVDKIVNESLDDKVDKVVDANLDENLSNKVERMVEEKLRKEKRANISKSLILLLSMALILALIYIAYDKGFIPKPDTSNSDVVFEDDKNKNSDKDENVDLVTKLEINDAIVIDTDRKINNAVGHCGVWEYYTDSKVSVNMLKNELVYEIAVLNAEDMFGKMNLTEEQFSKVVSSIFGKNYNYNHVQYSDKCAKFIYNWNTKSYDYQNELACGWTCGVGNFKKIIGAYKDDKTLTIEVGVLFAEASDDTIKYYKDYNHTEEVTGLSFMANDSLVLADTEDNARKGTKYKMVFNLEDGNYVYSYTEPVSN